MRRNKFSLILCSLLLLVFAACSQNENATNSTKAPPADVVRAEASKVEIKAGGSTEASVKLTIANGYHINANPASFSYLKATELTAEPAEGITPDKPVYPASVTRKFAFSPDPLAVYEGEATIKLPLNAAGNAQKGAHTLKAKLRIQACDEQSCYQPRTIELPIPVTVN
jgi:DsbC/DsbD-like thiol-disulfide interchange protein